MKIVIVGAGEVGTHLAKLLSNDDHDIVLLDDNEEKLKHITSHVDLMTVAGLPHSISDQKEAGVHKADLFIAVTPSEERNLVASILAKDLGAKRTIARVDSSEYLQPFNQEKFRELGVDVLIYPENLAAKEICTSLKQVGSRQMLQFSGGKLLVNAIKIRDNAPIVNKTLEEISATHSNFRAVALYRNNETIIPHGKDLILPQDVVYFISTHTDMITLLEEAGKNIFEVKNVMILGASRIGMKTAKRLEDKGVYNIKVVEQNKERSLFAADFLEKSLIINADGRDVELIKEEGLENMDAFVAVTGNSETNILSCHLAKRMGVRRTVAEVENIDYLSLADEIGIGTLINKKLIAASYIYRYTMDAEVAMMKCLTACDADVLEFIAKPGSKVCRKLIRDIGFPAEATIGGIVRGESGFIATGDTQIEAGDKVVVFSMPNVVKKLEKFFR